MNISKLIVGCAILLAPLAAFAGGTFSLTNGETRIVVPPVVSAPMDFVSWGATNGWSTNVTYGSLALIGGAPYVASVGGYAAAPVRASVTNVETTLVYRGTRLVGTNVTTNVIANVLQNMPGTGASSITDGTVVWLRCPSARAGYAIQWSSGGTAQLSINGGRFDISGLGIMALSLSGNPYGAVPATASGATTVNVVEW